MHTVELLHLTSEQNEILKYPSTFMVRSGIKDYDDWKTIIDGLKNRHRTSLDVEIELFRYCDCVMQTWQRLENKPEVGDVDVKVLRFTPEQKSDLMAYAKECSQDGVKKE